jgi:predicted class III extradiol MEMO1 family dioxygenase
MLAAQDAESIAAICRGDAAGFLELSRAERDRRKVCGLSPIYMALKLVGEARGESVGYAQCPADVTGGSLVSIVGAVLWEE